MAPEADDFVLHLSEFLGFPALLLVEFLHFQLKATALFTNSLVLHLLLFNLWHQS